MNNVKELISNLYDLENKNLTENDKKKIQNFINNLNKIFNKYTSYISSNHIILDNYNNFYEAQNDAKFTSQAEAMLYLIKGDNVFLTGPAGSGKSYIVQKYVDLVKSINPKVLIAKTSTTGLSALNIGGETINSWSGLYHFKDDYETVKSDQKYLAENQNDFLAKMWINKNRTIKKTKILIIDEISMLSEKSFKFVIDRLKDCETFNDTQIIVSGDFSQLPPVATRDDVLKYGESIKNFCYNTPSWVDCNFKNTYLDKLYRTSDVTLSKLLNYISLGKGRNENISKLLNSLPKTTNAYHPGKALLLSTNSNVDRINLERQEKNPGKKYILSVDKLTGPHIDNKRTKDLMKKNNLSDSLTIKDGDTIMITKNIESYGTVIKSSDDLPNIFKLSNGTIGTFKAITDKDFVLETTTKKGGIIQFPLEPITESIVEDVVNEEDFTLNKAIVAGYRQYPIKLAYAITIHKSQGQTFSNIVCDLTKCFTPGLGYVALSRAKTLNDITLFVKDGFIFNSVALDIDKNSLEIKKETMIKAKELRANITSEYTDLINNYEDYLLNRFK